MTGRVTYVKDEDIKKFVYESPSVKLHLWTSVSTGELQRLRQLIDWFEKDWITPPVMKEAPE